MFIKIATKGNESPQDTLRRNMANPAFNTSEYDIPPMPTEPTEQVVGREVGARGVPQMPPERGNIADAPPIADMQSLANAGRMGMVPNQPYGDIQYNEDGSILRDEAGNPVFGDTPMSAFAGAQQDAVGRAAGMQQAMAGTTADVMDPVGVARGILNSAGQSGDSVDARNRRGAFAVDADSKIDSWANKAAPTLDKIHNQTATDLFSNKDATARNFETRAPVGIHVAVDEGWVDPNSPTFEEDLRTLAPMSTVVGLSFFTAVNQATTADPSEGMQKRMVESANGSHIDDAMYMGDIVDAATHSVRNAFDRLGIKAKPENIKALAQAKVMSAIQNGDLTTNLDASGRMILTATPEVKAIGRKLKYLTEALTGDSKRMLPTKTPQVGGSTFDRPGSKLSKNSRKSPGIITAAADAVKDIFGRTGFVYKPKDVAYKKKEIMDMFGKEHAKFDEDTGQFKFSTSIYASRNKVSEAHYMAAARRHTPSKDPGAVYDETAHRAKQLAEATKVMDEKMKSLQYDLMNGEGLMGSVRFMAWSHALANQRFFPASSGMNYMESKTGARDMLNVGLQDGARGLDLFDADRVRELQGKARGIFRKKGWARHDAMTALTNPELAALGIMQNAVINYFTAVGPSIDKRVLKMSEAEAVAMYNPEIGKYLADMGAQYNEYLNDEQGQGNHESIINHLAAMEAGESLGNKNLWDDMFQLSNAYKDPVTRKKTVDMSHLNFDDGNQNGIFLQSLFFGNYENSLRLGAFLPSLSDMRGFALDSFLDKIDEMTKDDVEAGNGWKAFMKALVNRDGESKVASDLFKAPLMQNAYGKDASMFAEMVEGFFDSEANKGLVSEHLSMYAGSKNEYAAIEMAGTAVEAVLRTIIDSASTNMLKNIGRHSALTNTVLKIPGPTGDTLFFTPVGIVPQYLGDSDTEVWKAPDGTLRKTRSLKTTTMAQKDGPNVEFPEEVKELDPSATRGRQYFWNTKKKMYDSYDNPLGSQQQRLGPVMLIQSLDGDLVKMTTLFANRGRSVPTPAMWVHDSIISSPSGALLYRNMYNNVSIPAAVPYMKDAANRMTQAWEEGKQEAFRKTEPMEAVGIGAEGEYPSLGAYFDEQWDRVRDDSPYKEVFLKRAHNDGAKWGEYQKRINGKLAEARGAGWRGPGDIGPSTGFAGTSSENDRRAQLAVTPKQFRTLVDIASDMLSLSGPKGKLSAWQRNFPGKVEDNFKQLQSNDAIKKYGFAQMTPTGGNQPVSGNASAKPEESAAANTIEKRLFDFEVPKPVYAPSYKPKKEVPDPFA